jgi:hypothetical protein
MMASVLLKVLWKLYYESHIVLYCAMQAVPALDPTAHIAFASPEACLKQAMVSNSFGELHCVCRREARSPLVHRPKTRTAPLGHGPSA